MNHAPNDKRKPSLTRYVTVTVSFIIALVGFLVADVPDIKGRILVAYACWASFWGFILMYPAYLRSVHSHSFVVMRAYGYFHYGAFYIAQSILFGVLGGGIYRFVKELLALRGERHAPEKENSPTETH